MALCKLVALRRSATCIFALSLLSCAEKRVVPTSNAAPVEATSNPKKNDASTQASSSSVLTVPASFLSSAAAKSFVKPDGSAAAEGSLALVEPLDLNEDGAPEVLLVPGPRFCGTGGCMLPRVFQEKDGDWQEISALQSKTPQGNEVTSAKILPEVVGGYHSVALSRGAKSDWVIRFDGARYQLAPEAPTSDRVSEAKGASLMLAGPHFDKARNIAPVGVWDKGGANKNAKISVQITTPDNKTFSLSLGVIGAPDEWHQAFFPLDFAGAPETLAPGTYLVEYRLNDVSAASSQFIVK
jgi:hypothetical protein